MTANVVEHRIEQVFTHTTPGGLWSALDRAANEPTLSAGDVWRGLDRYLLTNPASASIGLWDRLTQAVDPTQYCPQAVPDVAEEQISDGDQIFTIIRSPRGNYLRLTEPQRAIWHQMDGSKTVAQLATQAFLNFKQLLPIGDLVRALREEGFLIDQPIGLYRNVGSALESRTAEGWGRRILRIFAGQTWQFQNIDGFYSGYYRSIGWLLFTAIFRVIWLLVVLAGLGAFIALLLGIGSAPAVMNSSQVPRELVALWCVLLVAFFLHESAHALAVKHFGRNLRAGGVMLYFGLPAFFVDTSDIWRSPRRARMLVSAAGPMSDLFVGGLAALLVLLHPGDTLANSIAYKLAFTCYIATLFNANPLLELDGYFILVDWLRLPDLRRRAIAFVCGPLWKKFMWPKTQSNGQHRPNAWTQLLASFSKEERIFTIYGILTLLYSLVAISFAVEFWQRKLLGTIRNLWITGEPLQQVVAAALVLVVVLPILIGLFFIGIGIGRAILTWLIKRGYGRQPALLAGSAFAIALLITILVARANTTIYSIVLPPVLWALALAALLAVRPDYRRAAVEPTLYALSLMSGLSGLAAIGRLLGVPQPIWMFADGVALLLLMIAGLVALLDVDIRLARPHELVGTALLLVVAFMVGGFALQLVQHVDSALGQIAAGAPAYFGVLALALLLPHLFELHDSRLLWSWLLMWGAVLVQTAAYIADISAQDTVLDVFAASLWLAAWLVHLATLRQIALDELNWPDEASISEEQRLTRAFRFCYIGCYRLLKTVYGTRRTNALDDRMDVLAATANWDVTLDRDRVRIAPTVLEMPLDLQGARYAEVLRYTVATIEQIAGVTFARRTIQAAYDALPWPERETASRYCFPDTPWARELSSAFGDIRAGRLRLLRQIDAFLNCDDAELVILAHAFQEQDVRADTILLRSGGVAPGMWVIEAGEVVAIRNGEIVAELHRGDSFGLDDAHNPSPNDTSYRTTVLSSLLFIPKAAYTAVTQATKPDADERDAAATLKLLERVPLFEDLPRNTLRGLAHIAQLKEFPARSVIVRQGVPSGIFYLIKQGRVAILARSAPTSDAPSQIRPVAQLGAEEFFGELELLRGTAPLASVVALTTLTVLMMPHAAIQAFLLDDGRVAKSLEQVGSGRLIALRNEIALSSTAHASSPAATPA